MYIYITSHELKPLTFIKNYYMDYNFFLLSMSFAQLKKMYTYRFLDGMFYGCQPNQLG